VKHLAIDADYWVYSCGFAAEGEPLSHALRLIKNKIGEAIEDTGADTHTLYIGGEGNFRNDIAVTKEYKGSRSARKPEYYNEIRQYMQEAHDAQLVNGMEADDKVSILLWEDYCKASGVREECTLVISSPDKDLNNTPGWHHNPRTREVKWISANQAGRHFWYQMLEGDSVDNIPGLPDLPDAERFFYNIRKGKGFGKTSAKKVMANSVSENGACRDVLRCYIAWGLSAGMSDSQIKDYLTEQGQLLWMTRETDDFDQPILFELEEGEYEGAKRAYERDRYGTEVEGEAGGGPEGREGLRGGEEAGDQSDDERLHRRGSDSDSMDGKWRVTDEDYRNLTCDLHDAEHG
jgi:hypothetical protein